MKKLTFVLLVGMLCGCNSAFETASPVGNSVWSGDTVPAVVGEQDGPACVRCGIVEQRKQAEAIAQEMLENDGKITIPTVPPTPAK